MSPDALRIERATRADLGAILALQRLAFAPEAERYPEAHARGDLAPLTQTLEDLEGQAEQQLLLKGTLDGLLVASVRGHIDEAGIAHIGRLIVHPQHQRHGYGAALMHAIEAALDAHTFTLFTDSQNAGNLHLYARLGYAPTGQRPTSSIPLVNLQKRRTPMPEQPLRVLVIDNYDSFTFNLVQALGALGADLTVWRNDAFTLDDVKVLNPDAIVVSPGPCTPNEAGLSVDVIRAFAPTHPTLGVCLGHQSIGAAFGATVTRALTPVHGKTSAMQHDGSGLFAGLAPEVTITRYHSLIVCDLPDDLVPIAWTDDPGERVLMALRHRTYPLHGVQFHPESIATPEGESMLANFLTLAREHQRAPAWPEAR